MVPDLNIRLANADDAELLAILGRETFYDAFAGHPMMPSKELNDYLDRAFSVRQLSKELADETSLFLLAETKGETAGYAKLEANSSLPGVTAEDPIKLKRLFCAQKFNGSGIGSSLLDRSLRESIERGHDVIWLIVWEHNLHAQAFYEKRGFEPCGLIDVRFGEVIFSDVVMQRYLNLKVTDYC
jgi:diamine N-acetyltransferase